MTTNLSFGSNNIQVYAYEGFDYTIVTPSGTTVLTLSNSSGLEPRSLYFTFPDASGNTRFSVTDLESTLIASTRAETFAITAANGAVSSNSVTINPGRFLDPSRNTFVGNSYTFYKSEPISNTLGNPFRLVAPSFELKQPTSIPSLPPGLSFVKVASNIYDISGIPLVTVPNSNYQIIGVQQGGSKVITTRFNMAISNERVQINAVNPLITNMQIGTPITPCVITSIPPAGTNVVRYTFSPFPDGIVARDSFGTVRTSPVDISNSADSNYTLTIGGAPTSNAAYTFRFDPSGMVYPIVASRINPAPLVQSNTTIQFTFGETVLFDQITLPQLYVGVPLDPSAIFFRAQTYYPSSNNIASITATSLPLGLSLNYTPGSDRAYLTGTPSNVGSASYTLEASNSNGKTQTYSVPISVVQDVVSFVSPTPAQDVCYNFVFSRPLTSDLSGYYPSNIRFVAQAASGLPVTLSAPALNGTGLSLGSNGVLTGTPTTVTSLADLIVTANVTGSPATASRRVKFAILNDQFYFTDVCGTNFNFIENVAITPFQIPVTTLSGRNVIDYSQLGFPSGISINPAGLVSGTPTQSSPTSGNVTIIPTTGYASGSKDFSYNLIPDSILFTVPQDNYLYQAGDAVDIQVTGTSFSGTPVRNFALTLPSSYGLTITPNFGLLGGQWTNSIPPNQVLPSSCNFNVTATAGGLNGVFPVSFTANPVLQNTSFVWKNGTMYAYNDVSWNTVSNLPSSLSNSFDIVIKNSNVDGNFIIGTAGSKIIRSSDAVNFSIVDVSGASVLSKLAFRPGGTDWWVAGQDEYASITRADLKVSEDNGLTWNTRSILTDASSGRYLVTRNSNTLSGGNQYLNGGVSLAYKGGVMLAGGGYDGVNSPVMLRSVDDGLTWSELTTGFARESAYFNVDHPTYWIATGSSLYSTASAANAMSPTFYTTSTDTIKYSVDQGATWSNATGAFTMFGYEIIYASNTWLATGVQASNIAGQNRFVPELRYSTNASNWTKIDLSTNPLFDPSNTVPSNAVAPLRLGSLNYDGSNWNVFVHREDASLNWVTEIYSSPTVTGTWTVRDVTSDFGSSGLTDRFLSYTRPQWLRTANTRDINISLSFNTGIGNGPQITSPSISSILLYQYVLTSIVVETDDPSAYIFISDEELPPGLEFNPLTGIISGKPAQQGVFTTRIYAKNSSGVTLKTIRFTVNVPRIIRKQDGAGAYTSLLKQYTEVLAAQGGRDNRALPNQERRLGEFMSPTPGVVVTAQFSTTKCGLCGRRECPTVNQRVDAGNASSVVCDFIDANSGTVFDAGNAGANVCD